MSDFEKPSREELVREQIIKFVKEDGGIGANLQLEGVDLDTLGLVAGVGVNIGQDSKCKVIFRMMSELPDGLKNKIEEAVQTELKQKENLVAEVTFE
ncbi:MAG TPA: hypothetical protein PLR18_00010 [bacterium]|nr:hypothetical protein [bacterium]